MRQVWHVSAHVERLQVQGDECVRGGRGGVFIRDWMLRHGKHQLNALEIGSVQVSEENRKLRSGIDSCAAVTVFPKTVAEVYCNIVKSDSDSTCAEVL